MDAFDHSQEVRLRGANQFVRADDFEKDGSVWPFCDCAEKSAAARRRFVLAWHGRSIGAAHIERMNLYPTGCSKRLLFCGFGGVRTVRLFDLADPAIQILLG